MADKRSKCQTGGNKKSAGKSKNCCASPQTQHLPTEAAADLAGTATEAKQQTAPSCATALTAECLRGISGKPSSTAAESADCSNEPPDCSAEPASCSAEPAESGRPSSDMRISKQHHVSTILDALLEEEIPEDPDAGMNRRFRYPIYVDALLGLGLLVAMAGFTVGLMKMFITHQAQQSIMQGDYSAAIRLLEETPMPPIFTMNGANPEETLAQAHYLNALQKFQSGKDSEAWTNLQRIRPGSHYFYQSQRLLGENYIPSRTILQCRLTAADAQVVNTNNEQ